MPAKLKLTYDLVAQIVELKRDGLCRTAGAVRVKAREATAEGGSALTRANPTRGASKHKDRLGGLFVCSTARAG